MAVQLAPNFRKLFLVIVLTVLLLYGCSSTAQTPQQEVAASIETPTAVTAEATAMPAASRGGSETNPSSEQVNDDMSAQAGQSQPTEVSPSASPPTAEPTTAPTAAASSAPPAAPPATAAPSPTPGSGGSQTCLNEAGFDSDVTIPDNTLLQPGEAFVKTWRLRNTGDCTWEGYTLVYAAGDLMDGVLSNSVPATAAGDYVDISINLVAPARGGQQTGYWELQSASGERFGVGSGGHDYIWVQIMVDYPAAPPSSGGSGGSGGSTPASCGETRNTAYEDEVLSYINAARLAAGLSALTLNPQLSAAAVAHSTDMACNNFIDHTGSDGSTWYDRVAAQGYANSASARENIYVGDPAFGGTPQGAFDWWMNSPVHYANIMYSTVSEIGIGYVYLAGSGYGGYYTTVFARP